MGSSKIYDDLESASSDSAEVIQRLGEEGEVQEQHLDHLFPIDIFPRVLLKATAILGVNVTSRSRVIFLEGHQNHTWYLSLTKFTGF